MSFLFEVCWHIIFDTKEEEQLLLDKIYDILLDGTYTNEEANKTHVLQELNAYLTNRLDVISVTFKNQNEIR